LYSKRWLAYCRHIRRILSYISPLTNKVPAHLRSTLMLRVMVSDLTQYTYSIQRLLSISRYSLFTYDPTAGAPLIRVYLLCITYESLAVSEPSVVCQTTNVQVQAWLIPHGPRLQSESMLHRYLNAAAQTQSRSYSLSTYPLKDGVHHTLAIDAQPWATIDHT
jgi:hypothetical protein